MNINYMLSTNENKIRHIEFSFGIWQVPIVIFCFRATREIVAMITKSLYATQ
jgi:hypothetical protein